MMTAANLGARLTGWGFVVFTLGSVCWIIVGLTSGQTNLVAANGFLSAVNLVGVWRWLGRQRGYEDGGQSAEAASLNSSAPTLVTATGVAGLRAQSREGQAIGRVVEALIECATGRISYVVIASSDAAGLREQLRPVPLADCALECDRLVLGMTGDAFRTIALLEDGDWPAKPAAIEPRT